jgi:HK97 family phage portal protein
MGSGLKSFSFSGGGGAGEYGGIWGWVNNLMPSAEYDYRRGAGLIWENSIVLSGLKWEADAFTSSLFCVRRNKGKTGLEIADHHPLTALIRNPNPYWDETLLLQATRMSFSLDGNAYWYKVRSDAGKVVQLWWVPHWMIEPAWNPDGSEYLGAYHYKVNGKVYTIPATEIVHFRDGIDPSNYRKGLSRLSAVTKEICTDNERATFSAAVLRNGGVPSVIITPDGDGAELPSGMSPKDYADLWMAKLTGDRRGEPFVSELPIKIQKPGFNPAELVLDKISRIPESRITSAMRIPAIVLGFEVGLEHATYSNYESALKAAYHHNVLPAYRVMAATIDRQLGPDIIGMDGCESGFDTSKVQALQEDKNEIADRAAALYTAGVAKRSEAKEMVDLPFDAKHDDVYLTDLSPAPKPVGPKPAPLSDDTAKALAILSKQMKDDKKFALTEDDMQLVERAARRLAQQDGLAREIALRQVR